ncbi:MAG: type I restriction enzyme HsdR N-terminal domain-containing protein [Chryseobacterium sp.]|nr:MAG: type I restriction enzyme HsdR N-terminal domain-containing protein [Chryseobacterium sp.]
MQLPKLCFDEEFDFRFKQDKDKFFIYDLLRKSWLLMTPEEWVRQHWIRFYLGNGYAVSALIAEQRIVLNNTVKRLDLLVTEKTKPKILLEFKAPDVKLTQDTFEQVARYNSIIGARQIILSNGLQHIRAEYSGTDYRFV